MKPASDAKSCVGCTGSEVKASDEIKPAFSCRTQACDPAGKQTPHGHPQAAPWQQPFKKQPIRPMAIPMATAGAATSVIRQKGNGRRNQ
jgi:hypothetical protein